MEASAWGLAGEGVMDRVPHGSPTHTVLSHGRRRRRRDVRTFKIATPASFEMEQEPGIIPLRGRIDAVSTMAGNLNVQVAADDRFGRVDDLAAVGSESDRPYGRLLGWLSLPLPARERERFVAEAQGDLGVCEGLRERVGWLLGVLIGMPGLVWTMRLACRQWGGSSSVHRVAVRAAVLGLTVAVTVSVLAALFPALVKRDRGRFEEGLKLLERLRAIWWGR